jgi:hypothetical protein
MSIDERLRTGLGTPDAEPTDRTLLLERWAEVEARVEAAQRRDRARWLLGVAAAVALLAAVGISWWPRGDDSVEPSAPVPSPSASTPEPQPVEGTWNTGAVAARAVSDQLGSVGLGQWSDAVLDGVPTTATISYELKLQGGRVTLTRAVDGAAAEVQDSESYTVNRNRLELKPDSNCSSVLDWQVDGDQLRLAVVSDSCPDYRGTPDEAYIQSLYAAFPFTRSGS